MTRNQPSLLVISVALSSQYSENGRLIPAVVLTIPPPMFWQLSSLLTVGSYNDLHILIEAIDNHSSQSLTDGSNKKNRRA